MLLCDSPTQVFGRQLLKGGESKTWYLPVWVSSDACACFLFLKLALFSL